MSRVTRTAPLIAFLCLLPFYRTAAATPHLSLHRIWQHSLSAIADSAPAYLPRVKLGNGQTRPLVYVLAGNNGSNCSPGDPLRQATLYALDAANGKLIWSRTSGGAQRCTTAGPVVDPSGRWVYAPGLDGKVHRYSAATGKETHGHGWPVTVTLMGDVEKVSATPTIGTQYLYVATSGFIGDRGHYEGHLVSVDLRTGHAFVFNSLCSTITTLLGPTQGAANYCPDVESGLFGRGQGTVDPITHDVFVVSGNGPWNGRTNWGDSVLKLDPSGSRLLDTFTPTNQHSLNVTDEDLGSTGPAMLPPIVRIGRTYHLLVQGGKGPACDSCSGVALRLLNRDNLSGQGGPGHLGGDLADAIAPGGSEVLTAPAVWESGGKPHVFYANDSGFAAYTVGGSGATFTLTRVWSSAQGGTTPVISHGVLYVAHGGGLWAYAPKTGTVLWRESLPDIHWQYPLVAGGRVFISDQSGRVSAYSIGT